MQLKQKKKEEMQTQRHQSKGFTLVELAIIIAIISTILSVTVVGARARLDQAAVNRDIADMEMLLDAGKALWARKVEISVDVSSSEEIKTFTSDSLPTSNGAKLCNSTTCTAIASPASKELTPDNWIRFKISQDDMIDWLNEPDQLSGSLPGQFVGSNHQNEPYYLFLKEHMVEVGVCLSDDISVDEAYVSNPDACRGEASLQELRLSTSARNARLTF
tara:strand:+ start:233 stop:886 length:654 start_codon:yes stop_codon:yes gene_type:complete